MKSMALWKYHKDMFNDPVNAPIGWHFVNFADGQQGEFTLCGIAFDGDANNSKSMVIKKEDGKVTCQDCIAVIKLCRKAKI